MVEVVPVLLERLRREAERPFELDPAQVQVRDAGGAEPLAASLGQWRLRLTWRGRAMLSGAARLAEYLDAVADGHLPRALTSEAKTTTLSE